MEQLTVLPRTTFGLSTRVSHVRAEDDVAEPALEVPIHRPVDDAEQLDGVSCRLLVEDEGARGITGRKQT